MERFNRTLEAMLAKTVSKHQQDGPAYRTTIHKATDYTSFHVTFGRSPVLPVALMMGVPVKQKEALTLQKKLDFHRCTTVSYM